MKIYQLKCPSCGRTVEVERNRDFCFCSYCGAKLFVNDETLRVEINKNINYHKTYTDEAKMYKIKAEERAQERKFYADYEERKHKKWSTFGFLFITFLFIIGFVVIFTSQKESSNIQEAELQAIVDEIMQDVEDGNFDEAYIKAEKIRYTEDWSSEIEDKWDATRNEVIKQIKRAEKENRNDTGGDTWWNPFD